MTTKHMTTDTQIAELANALILDMYQCRKQGIFKGYINWFATSYQRAVEARRQMEDFRRMVTVNKPVSSGPTTSLIPGRIGYIPMGTRMSSVGDSHFVKMHMPTKISDVLFDTPDEPKIQGQSPLTVKFHPDGSVEYGYDLTKGTAEQAGNDLVERYTAIFGADASIKPLPPAVQKVINRGANLERPAQTDTRG